MTTALYYARLLLGTAVYSVSFAYLVYPAALVSGGVTGIATIIDYASGFPVGAMIIILNVPIFWVGFRKLGLRFMVDSLIATVAMSLLIDALKPSAVALTEDALLAALFGGTFGGLGLGIALTTGATTGGSDIIAKLVHRSRPDFNVGQLLLAFNVLVLLLYTVLLRNFELAMYSAIAMYVSSYVVDLVLYGLNYGKLVYIISESPGEINARITSELKRGATVLHGEGAYSGNNKQILLVAIKKRQIVDLKRIISQTDPAAFVIITETKEVVGRGFEHTD